MGINSNLQEEVIILTTSLTTTFEKVEDLSSLNTSLRSSLRQVCLPMETELHQGSHGQSRKDYSQEKIMTKKV
jgi:hypothetical protein